MARGAKLAGSARLELPSHQIRSEQVKKVTKVSFLGQSRWEAAKLEMKIEERRVRIEGIRAKAEENKKEREMQEELIKTKKKDLGLGNKQQQKVLGLGKDLHLCYKQVVAPSSPSQVIYSSSSHGVGSLLEAKVTQPPSAPAPKLQAVVNECEFEETAVNDWEAAAPAPKMRSEYVSEVKEGLTHELPQVAPTVSFYEEALAVARQLEAEAGAAPTVNYKPQPRPLSFYEEALAVAQQLEAEAGAAPTVNYKPQPRPLSFYEESLAVARQLEADAYKFEGVDLNGEDSDSDHSTTSVLKNLDAKENKCVRKKKIFVKKMVDVDALKKKIGFWSFP